MIAYTLGSSDREFYSVSFSNMKHGHWKIRIRSAESNEGLCLFTNRARTEFLMFSQLPTSLFLKPRHGEL